MVKTLKFWVENSRWVALPQSVMPAVTAVALAALRPEFSALMAALAVLGVCLAHLSLNLFDDYFDYKKNKPGIRDTLQRAGMRARTGKCTYLTSGQATVRQLLWAALLFGLLSGGLGVAVFISRGLPILWIVLAAGLLGLFYSADPLRLSYRGFGELVIGIIFGPLVVVGIYIAACGVFDWKAVYVGAAMGLLVTNVIYTHSMLDLDADRSVGKLTLAGLIKSKKRRLVLSYLMTLLPYVLIVLGALFGQLSAWYLLAFLSLPLATALMKTMHAFCLSPGGPVRRRLWYGPMQRWQLITEYKLEWFMLRWYLARNLVMAFSLLCILATALTGR